MIDNRKTDELLKIIQGNFLKLASLEPSRGSNILDLVLTSREKLITQENVGGQL